MTPSTAPAAAEPRLESERRDNRIVAVVMGATVVISMLLLYTH